MGARRPAKKYRWGKQTVFALLGIVYRSIMLNMFKCIGFHGPGNGRFWIVNHSILKSPILNHAQMLNLRARTVGQNAESIPDTEMTSKEGPWVSGVTGFCPTTVVRISWAVASSNLGQGILANHPRMGKHVVFNGENHGDVQRENCHGEKLAK